MYPANISNSAFVHLVRRSLVFRRCVSRLPPPGGKPPLIPPARTKRYSIVQVPWQSPDDVKELVWRRHIYNDAVATYRAMYKRETEEKMKGAMGEEAIRRREEEEFQQVLRENEMENRTIAERRKSKLTEQLRLVEADTLNEIDATLRMEEQKLKQLEAEVQSMVDQADEFITLENMEEKILAALENPKEYNFAVDLDGNVYQGDVYLKYLTETPLGNTPVSEVSAPLRKAGRYVEGRGLLYDTEKASATST